MRMKPKDRSAAILDAAITVAEQKGFANMRMQHVADAADCSTALVVVYHTTMTQLRRAVVRQAAKRGLWKIVGQAVACGDPTAGKLDTETRQKAIAALAS